MSGTADPRGTKRKAEYQTLEELIETPWCYYCDRTFSDGKVLHDHQKAKHFQCSVGGCHRRLNTAGGLRVHMQQVHKEELHQVDNALEGRRDPNIEIFGMVGIPEQIHEERVGSLTQKYQSMQREHRRKTGNPLPGEVKDNAHTTISKTQQLAEGMSDIKARVAAAKAKREAEKAAKAAGGLPSTPATLTPTTTTLTPATTSMTLNGSATPEMMGDAQRTGGQSSPAPGTFNAAAPPNYPGSPMNWAGTAAPFQPPQVQGYATGTHSSPPPQWAQHLPGNPYSQPQQFQGGYAPPPPMHNGVNNGFQPSPPLGAAPRQQHALPILPPTPAGLPQRPSFAPQRPGINGLPQHPGHFNGQSAPAHGTAPSRPIAQAADQSENAKRAQLAEDFLTQFSANNSVAASSPIPPQAAVAPASSAPMISQPLPASAALQNGSVAPPPVAAPKAASVVKQAKNKGNEKAMMKLSNVVNIWEELRAHALRYAAKRLEPTEA